MKMYENVGFKTVDENVEEYIKVCELQCVAIESCHGGKGAEDDR